MCRTSSAAGDPYNERRNPARPEEVAVVSPRSDVAAVDAALSAAVEAQTGWAATPPPAGGRALLDAAELSRRPNIE
jgi:aldehyde dehydrogenase (NAD+)